MRYINIKELVLPDGWLSKARELHKQLETATPDDRTDIIKKNQIWQDLFIPLQDLSRGKCWYSEAREIMSDRDVDHFRPKSEARNMDEAAREGYWWLAYDWENYRFSSIYSNRGRYDKFDEDKEIGGKWYYFPLFPDSIIAKTKARIVDEDIMLLDPTDEDDPVLLTFDDNGEALPNTTNVKDIERVKVSIRLYHLDHTPLKEETQKVWARCQRFINAIQEIYSQPEMSISDKARIKFLKQEIKVMMEFQEELSAVAIACVENNKLARMLRA